MSPIHKTGEVIVDIIKEVGATVLFARESLRAFLKGGIRLSQVVDQMYAVGVRSVPTTLLAGGFVGAIMAIQIDVQLRDFGAQGVLGGLATSVTIRNVGPVLIGFILSGKVGAYTSAELGTMQVTSQMDAIRCLGMNPIQYLIVPRMVAAIISSFLLLIVGLLVTIAGGALIASFHLGLNGLNYIQNIPRFVNGWSVASGVVKSFVFGTLIALICCFQGYHAKGGAAGVGKVVKRTAVVTLVSIIVADFTISSIFSLVHQLVERWGW